MKFQEMQAKKSKEEEVREPKSGSVTPRKTAPEQGSVTPRRAQESEEKLKELTALADVSISDLQSSIQSIEMLLEKTAQQENKQSMVMIARIVKMVKMVVI